MAIRREQHPGACDPAPEEEDAAVPDPGPDAEPDPLPEAFRSAAGRRRMLREALGAITQALLTKAQEGSATHLKLLMDLGAYEKGTLAPKRRRRTERNLEELLMEQWRQDRETLREHEAIRKKDQQELQNQQAGGVDGS